MYLDNVISAELLSTSKCGLVISRNLTGPKTRLTTSKYFSSQNRKSKHISRPTAVMAADLVLLNPRFNFIAKCNKKRPKCKWAFQRGIQNGDEQSSHYEWSGSPPRRLLLGTVTDGCMKANQLVKRLPWYTEFVFQLFIYPSKLSKRFLIRRSMRIYNTNVRYTWMDLIPRKTRTPWFCFCRTNASKLLSNFLNYSVHWVLMRVINVFNLSLTLKCHHRCMRKLL